MKHAETETRPRQMLSARIDDANDARFAPDDGWRAELALEFRRDFGRTALARACHRGPLRVQRALYPEPDRVVPHVHLLHPPGGIVGGDVLDIRIDARDGAHALLTMPAATKLYMHPTATSAQSVRIAVRDRAWIEWLPQETIAFSGARSRLTLTIDLEAEAGAIAWEILALGRLASALPFESGRVDQRIVITRAGTPLVLEHARIGEDGRGAIFGGQAARWGLAGWPVVGAMFAVAPPDAEVPDIELIRGRMNEASSSGKSSVTELERGLLAIRYLGESATEAREIFECAREALRPLWTGRAACRPRIWDT